MVEYYVPSWDDIEDSIFDIAEKIVKDAFVPDAIIAILTGGVIPAKLLADLLGVKTIRYIEIKFYRAVGSTENKPIIKAVYVHDLENKNVLIVDDVADTGETLEAVTNIVAMFNPKKIKTATIYIKPWSKKIPDYYSEVVDKWIIFPWDKWEVVRENGNAPVKNKERFLRLMKART